MQTIDTRGLSCPQPLVMVQPVLGGDTPVAVLVDNDASRENVTRAAERKGWLVISSPEADGATRLELRR